MPSSARAIFTGSFDPAFFAAAANISHMFLARQYAYSFSLPGKRLSKATTEASSSGVAFLCHSDTCFSVSTPASPTAVTVPGLPP